jgi:hypothetical protein
MSNENIPSLALDPHSVTLITTYDTTVIGLLGFIGVMATIWYNSKIDRDAHARKMTYDKNAVLSAILEEVRIIIRVLQKHKSIEYKDGSTAIVSRERADIVFKSMISRIGILEEKTINLMIATYYTYETLNNSIALISSETTEAKYANFFEISPSNVESFKTMSESVLEKFVVLEKQILEEKSALSK